MRYIVGYTPDQRGAEALALAAAIARTQDAHLDLVHVLDNPRPEAAGYPERGVQQILAGNAKVWLQEALALLPPEVTAQTHLHYAESFAEGLIEVAQEVGAGLIVIGAAKRGILKHFSIGTVANTLLHASPVPVALAPSGYESTPSISRITCTVGGREGARELLNVAADSSSRRHVPLRLVSLLAVDQAQAKDANQFQLAKTKDRIDELVATAAVSPDMEVTAVVAPGSTIEEAIENLQWHDNEVVLIGSSRLAEGRKLFLGRTAYKLLRELPVPMIVVPRDYQREL